MHVSQESDRAFWKHKGRPASDTDLAAVGDEVEGVEAEAGAEVVQAHDVGPQVGAGAESEKGTVMRLGVSLILSLSSTLLLLVS